MRLSRLGERILEHQKQVGVAFSFTAGLAGEDRMDAVLPIVIQSENPASPTPTGSNVNMSRLRNSTLSVVEFDRKYKPSLLDMPLAVQ